MRHRRSASRSSAGWVERVAISPSAQGVSPFALLLAGAIAQAQPPTPGESPPAHHAGASEDIANFDLQELLSTEVGVGTTDGSDLRSAPATVEILTAEQIERLGIADIRELLLHFTGIYQSPSALSPLFYPTVRLRSEPVASRILLLVDDHPKLTLLTDHNMEYAIPIGSIERAEFLRGPAAILYGSNAMAGTLRLVTKKDSARRAGARIIGDPVGRGGSVELHGGFNTRLGGEPLLLRADLQVRRTEDWRVWVPSDSDGAQGRHKMQVQGAASLVTMQLGGLSVRLNHSVHRGTIFGLETRFAFDPGPSSLSTWGADLGYRKPVGSVQLHARMAVDYQAARIDAGMLPPQPLLGRTAEENRSEASIRILAGIAQVSASYRTRWWRGSLGLQGRNVRTTEMALRYQNDRTPHVAGGSPLAWANAYETNLFFQGSVTPTESLSLLVGGRASHYSARAKGLPGTGTEETKPEPTFDPMGQGAVVWKVHESITAKAIYGRSYRLPTLFDRFGSLDGVLRPNPNIKPELQDTYELALDTTPFSRLTLRLSAFHNRMFRHIRYTPAASGLASYGNVGGTLDNTGADLVAHWTPLSATTIEASFTYQVARRNARVVYMGMPKTVALLRMYQDIGSRHDIKISTTVRMRGPMQGSETDVMLDLALLWKLSDWLNASLTAHNVFDRQYYMPYGSNNDIPGYARRTRTLRLGVSVTY